MKKISYRNTPPREPQKPTSGELPKIGVSDSATELGGAAGFLLPGLPDTHKLPDQQITTEHVGLIEDFISMADGLDDDGLESEADFVDFLIQKFGSVSMSPSEEERYIEYIYKIYNSDIPNSLDKIKKLTLNYSKNISSMMSEGADKESSKKSSFDSALMREGSND